MWLGLRCTRFSLLESSSSDEEEEDELLLLPDDVVGELLDEEPEQPSPRLDSQ